MPVVLESFQDEYNKIIAVYNDAGRLKQTAGYMERMTSKPIVIFGASFTGDSFYNKLLSIEASVVAFCDNFRTGTTPNGNGPIINVTELKKNYMGANLVIAVHMDREKVAQQLLEMGFNAENIFQDVNCMWAQGGPEEFEQYKDGYAWAYNFFSDTVSKSIVLGRIKRYLFGEPLKTTTCGAEYFLDDVITLTEDEVFIDGGGYTGDTVQEFLKQTNHKFKHIYSFEPEESNYQKTVAAFKEQPNITFIKKGLWKKNGELQFQVIGGTGLGSFYSEQVQSKNIVSVPVTSLDSFFADKPESEWPTFIKLDIEGAELDAIKGAKNIIRTCLPKMAVCVYHKPQDVYELPKMILYSTPPPP
jgi:FkbM family methyltransferase